MSCLPSRCNDVKPAIGFLQAGAGETILLLHGSASSSIMWQPTMALLQPLYHVIAPDLIGYGSSPAWRKAQFSVDDEVAAIKPLLPCCGGPFHLVGYSYGGLVALGLALANPWPVRTLTLIEPVFFSALRYADNHEPYARFVEEGRRFNHHLDDGYRATAMNAFIKFWCGHGTWERFSGATRCAMIDAADKVALDWQASFLFDPGAERLNALADRTAIIHGDQSPEPMLRLVDALHGLMPGSVRSAVPGANHLLPLTHTVDVVKLILEHLHIDSERRLH
jgi:pimeloyl-ACP methyl ester carboxylesterase